MLTFKNFNIADWFSFYIVFAIPILLLLLLMGERQIFAFALLVSYSTDMIDGFLARKLKITSARGSQLDSLGDQLTFIMGLLGLLAFEYDFIKENYIDKGKMGVSSGEGFYKYPNPSYEHPDFLK